MVDGKSSDDMEHANNDDDKQLNVNGSLTDESELIESLIKRSGKWAQLKRLIFKYNNLERIDESLVRIMYTV